MKEEIKNKEFIESDKASDNLEYYEPESSINSAAEAVNTKTAPSTDAARVQSGTSPPDYTTGCAATTPLENIPAELKERNQWIPWKSIEKGGRDAKVPFQPDGTPAKTDDPSTWSSFDKCVSVASRFNGLGYVFSADDPYTGIDLDSCFDPETGEISDWAKRWITKLNSYSEISPSGCGVKVWVKAKFPFGNGKNLKLKNQPKIRNKVAGVEAYDHGRYFCVTGKRLAGLSNNPEPRQEELNELYDFFFKADSPGKEPEPDRTSSSSTIERARRYLDRVSGAISGEAGHNQTFKVACILIHGFALGRAESFVLLSEWNKKCRPKWSDKELRYKIISADKKPNERGYLLKSKESEWGELPDYEQEERAAIQEEGAEPEFKFYPLIKGLEPQPDEGWIIHGLLAKRWVMMIFASPGAKKTYAALDIGVAVSQGEYWLNYKTIKSKVLLIDEESGERRVLRRAGDAFRGHGVEQDDNFIGLSFHGFNLLSTKGKEDFFAVIEQAKPDLVIMDVFANFMLGGEENAVKETLPVLHVMRQAAERFNCGILVLHHDNRSGGYRGSSALKGAVDMMLKAESEPDKSLITFTAEKTRDVITKPFDATAHFEPGKFWLSPATMTETAAQAPRKATQRVVGYLSAHGPATIKIIGCGSFRTGDFCDFLASYERPRLQSDAAL